MQLQLIPLGPIAQVNLIHLGLCLGFTCFDQIFSLKTKTKEK
jgi:hypothetical protein